MTTLRQTPTARVPPRAQAAAQVTGCTVADRLGVGCTAAFVLLIRTGGAVGTCSPGKAREATSASSRSHAA